MDPMRYAELVLRHRHGDGSWSRLEPRPSHHDPADHDIERTWKDGQVFACPSCDEQVQVGFDRSDEARGR
jgi:hypothetical protein